MPKLSALQWAVLFLLLAFYGFAVFAFTRDYYLRNPPAAVATAPATQMPHDMPGAKSPTWIQGEIQGGAPAPMEVSGTDPVVLNRQGDELFARKRYEEAIPFYRRVLELDPGDVDAHNDLGLALHYTGQSAEALGVLRRGTQQAPDFQRIWLTLGFVSANAGETAAAAAALEKARSLDPDSGVGQEAARLLGLLSGE